MRKLFTLALGMLFAAGFAQAQPTTVPGIVETADSTVGLYSTAAGTAAGYYFDNWGATTTGSEVTIDSKKVYLMQNFTYYGSQFATIDVTGMTYLHFDVYPMQDMNLSVVPITTGGIEKGVQSSLKGNEWNTIDIPVADLVKKGCKMDQLWQIKYVSTTIEAADGVVDGFGNGTGTESFYIGNIYFYKAKVSYDDTEAPVFTVDPKVGEISYASAYVTFTATDNKSASIYYTATDKESGKTYTAIGNSGESTTMNITGLATGTEYTFSIVAADEVGNKSEAKEVTITTAAIPLVPQPTAVVYKSIYSSYLGNTDGYFFNNWGGGSGTEITVDDQKAYEISNFYYFGSEFTSVDVSKYTYLHIDVLPLDVMTLCIVPITGTIEKGVNFELSANKWNSLETTVAGYTQMGCNMANLYQIKYVSKKVADGGTGLPDGFQNGDGTQKFLVGNVYFYTPQNTAVEDLTVATPAVDGPAYNVFGQIVGDDYKGIVIKNGKKEIRK